MGKRRLIAIIASAVAILLVSYIAFSIDLQQQLDAQATRVSTKSKYEVGPPTTQEMLELVNKERKKVGVKPLVLFDKANQSAQYKADDFVTRNYYSHLDPVTKRKNGLDYLNAIHDDTCSHISENIAADYRTSKQMIDVWMKSPSHKKAILDARYSLTGFGVAQESDGDYYAVEHFCITY